MNRLNRDKIMAVLLCLLLLLLSWSALFALSEHSTHHCEAHDCPVCMFLHVAKAFFSLLKQGLILAFGAVLLIKIYKCLRAGHDGLIIVKTPVLLKTHINN